MFNVVVLNNQEDFIEFINPDVITINETYETQGLRTIEVEYNIQELANANKLFKLGNKLWVTGDNVEDCLYVINTSVKKDLFKENVFTFEAEEVLVELNYAPLFSQTELTKSNFTLTTVNNEPAVVVNYNALNYWFGEYFNIGVVQACLSSYSANISVNGTMTLMSLLRLIEEETGNIFVTRYEKDVLNNTIHRYLDFLNPISQNKNWELNLEYDFMAQENINGEVYDENDNPTTEDPEDETDDPAEFTPNTPIVNINPANAVFRCTKDGEVIVNGNDELIWTSNEVGFNTNTSNVVIQLKYKNNNLGVSINGKTFASTTDAETGGNPKGYINTWAEPIDYTDVVLPNGSCFEIYDTVNQAVVFSKKINAILSNVHSDVLDLGYNVNNIELEIDENDTFTAISPVFSLEGNNEFSKSDMDKIITGWLNLEVTKGEKIPMIVEKVTITGTNEVPCVSRTGAATSSTTTAAALLGEKNKATNWWKKPLHGNDNTEQTNRSYEYWVATAYWIAPFDKNAGEMHVSLDNDNGAEYTHICGRPDIRDNRNTTIFYEKMGTVETSDEDVYAIYNDVALKLKEKKDPQVNLDVEVANLRDGLYNEYNVHDKVYIKLPGSNDLITARVEKTEKNPHDITENKITLGNYSINTKEAPKETYIDAKNASFKYPNKKTLTATLVNAEYDEEDSNSSQYLSNKLVTFTLYKIDNGSATLTKKISTKTTNSNGQASINMKYDPGDYEIDISFGGDAEYSESSLTVEVNVSGKKAVPKNTTSTSSSKSGKTTKKVKTYYTKCGLSPDKKHKKIVAIAKPSGTDAKKYGYRYYKTVFENKCPICGKKGTLRFDGGSKNKCITSAGAHGRGYKIGVPEHEITCNHCDSDYCGVTGIEKWSPSRGRLKTLKKPVKSSSTEFNKLVKGKLQYGTKTVTVAKKTKTTNKSYNNHSSGINKTVKQKAISIASGTSGITAMKKIAAFMGSKINYGYSVGFTKSAKSVLTSKKGNCCSQTRLMLQMMDVVDTENQFKLEYVRVCCGPKGVGHVFAKVTTRATGKWRYVDPCKKDPWGHYVHGWGSPPGSRSTYPTKPF